MKKTVKIQRERVVVEIKEKIPFFTENLYSFLLSGGMVVLSSPSLNIIFVFATN